MSSLSLSQLSKDSYLTIFAADAKDTSTKKDAAGLLAPNPNLRTIFIGLGGTGIKTIDAIKGAFQKRFADGWESCVGFLGIDSSWSELEQAAYLTKAEMLCETLDGVTQRMSTPATYPQAVRPFMPGDLKTAPTLGGLNSDGAGMTRLTGKVKIHDKDPSGAGMGVDEEIVNRIMQIMAKLPLPVAIPSGQPPKYDIYVIGSGSGGTCSGGFLEMPALIKKTMSPCSVKGILYLPDTLTELAPTEKAKLEANGYATLKELDYFQGMEMRLGYTESWPYNDPAEPEIRMDRMYQAVYLIGSPGVAAANASAVAREVISEFLVSLLVQTTAHLGGGTPFVTSALESNTEAASSKSDKTSSLDDPDKEPVGEAHDFNRCYAAIGFGQASAPAKLIQAYKIHGVCQRAGLHSADLIEREQIAMAGGLPPFSRLEDKLTASQGTKIAKELLAPLKGIHAFVSNGDFDFIKDLGLAPDVVTFKAIRENTFSTDAFANKMEKYISDRTSSRFDKVMEDHIENCFKKFRENVVKYVKDVGPYAFYNVFKGRFIPEGSDAGLGIEDMLKNFIGAKTDMGNGDFSHQYDVDNTAKARVDAKKVIDEAPLLSLKHTQFANGWISATNAWVIARINEKRAKAAYGNHGFLYQKFFIKAMLLADQVKAFGDIVETLAEIYDHNGKAMEDFGSFATASDKSSELNVGGLNQSSYNWLKEQADEGISNANARQFRDSLVDEFFSNPEKWLEIPDGIVNTGGSSIVLFNPENPVPARRLFDDFAKEQVPMEIDVSIGALFVKLKENGQDYDKTAQQILDKLNTVAKLRFNGTVSAKFAHKYVQYPSSLAVLADGAAIVSAIQTAAKNIGIQPNNVYASSDTDSILMYHQASNIEIYRIANLPAWQAQYESKIALATYYGHGKSPDVEIEKTAAGTEYREITPWKDYHSIVLNGKGSKREEMLLKDEKDFVEEAKALGLLYSEQNPDGTWDIWRISLEGLKPESFSVINDCIPNNVGLLPEGGELLRIIMGQNGIDAADNRRKVELAMAGIFTNSAKSEAAAWDKVPRILRNHRPMHRELRHSMELMRVWNGQAAEYNEDVRQSFRPAMMMWLLKAGILFKDPSGAWLLQDKNGKTSMVANYSTAMYKFVPPQERKSIENGLLGYELFKKLDAKLPGSALVAEMERAKQLYEMFVSTQDFGHLEEGETLFSIVDQERAALEAVGANDGSTPIPFQYKNAMSQKLALTDQQLMDIARFYFNTNSWEFV